MLSQQKGEDAETDEDWDEKVGSPRTESRESLIFDVNISLHDHMIDR